MQIKLSFKTAKLAADAPPVRLLALNNTPTFSRNVKCFIYLYMSVNGFRENQNDGAELANEDGRHRYSYRRKTSIQTLSITVMATRCSLDRLRVGIHCCMSEYDYAYNSTNH